MSTSGSAEGGADSQERRIVWRTVLPERDIAEVVPLYLDGEADGAGLQLTGRASLSIPAGRTVSFGSYFNAFPAAYWQAHTAVREVRLRVRASAADGLVRVFRSDAAGKGVLVAESGFTPDQENVFDLPLSGFDGGGLYWFDLAARGAALEFAGADWSIATTGPAGTATVGMATFNRPSDCLNQLLALIAAPEVLALIDRVVVVDQGTDNVEAQTGFASAAAALGDRLVLIRQPNLGGSGGFSRAMAEALARDESDYVLILDDDAISEPEAIARAIAFADAAATPAIVGGGMLHLDDRAVLYTQSEQWDRRIGWVDLDRPGAYDHDFASAPLRESPFLHALHRSDFNGWWMCLIPVPVLRRVGLALPLFLKGDDVEFGMRAAAHGIATVSVPGVAVWHLGWGGKAPTRSWEAYFLHRNRLIGELLHTPSRRPAGVIAHSFLGDLKPLLTLQYGAVALRAQAIVDVFAGPERLPGRLGTRVAEIREGWAGFPDAASVDTSAATIGDGTVVAVPSGRVRQAALLARMWGRHLLRRESRESGLRPDAHVTASELTWASFARIDSAFVDTSDGTATVWYRRRRRDTVRALWRSVRLHARLWRLWPRLSRQYRDAAPGLASPDAWARIFEGRA
ncbi:glycosyltransferase [Microbacterium sp. BWT-B31]|uniref:glycosyltransferase n=1 Tax=Microbacterium sp. BWT-B31 TaxID=3232072 RepID=UPI003526CF07